MTQPIDIAYVELRAKGEDVAAADIKKMLEQIQRDVKKLSNDVEKDFNNAARDIEKELTEAGSILTKEATRQRKEWKKVAESIATDVEAGTEVAKHAIDSMADSATHDMDRIAHSAEKAAASIALAGVASHSNILDGRGNKSDSGGGLNIGRDVSRAGGLLSGFGDALRNVGNIVRDFITQVGEKLSPMLQDVGKGFAQVGSTISSILGPIWSFVSGMGMVGVVIALLPVLIPLVSALSQLGAAVALLPGTLGILAGALITVKMAFSGMGDAVSALASGNLKKIDEAMKKLSPSARAFAVEINNVRQQFSGLKKQVQENFFAPLRGQLQNLATAVLPTLRVGLDQAAGALGRFLASIMHMISLPGNVAVIGKVFASLTRIVDDMSPKVTHFLNEIFKLVGFSLPFIERAFHAMGNGLESVSNWLDKVIKNGDLKKWMEGAFRVAGELWDLLKAVGGLIGAIFGGLSKDGESTIKGLTEWVKKLTDYFKSPEGKKGIHDLVDAFKQLGAAIMVVTGVVLAIAKWFNDFSDTLGKTKGKLEDAWHAVEHFFSSLWGSVQSIGKSVGDFFNSIGDGLSSAWDALTKTGGQVIQWFQDLPGKIGTFLSSLPGMVAGFFVDMAKQSLYEVGYMVGAVARFFMDLPHNIAVAATSLWNTVTTWFNKTKDSAVTAITNLVNGVVDWFTKLPGRASKAASNLWHSITKLVDDTRDSAVKGATNLVNNVVDWFSKLPGRAMKAITSLPGDILKFLHKIVDGALDIGSKIMSGIGDGIRNGWNSAINAAKDAAKQVMKGFWDAFKIKSPSRLTAETVGVPLVQGIGVGVDHAVPDLHRTLKTSMAATVDVMAGAVSSTSANSGTMSGSDGVTIQNLTVSIAGVWDMNDTQATRVIAVNIIKAIEKVKKEYR